MPVSIMNAKQVLRVKPGLPSSGSRIALTHTLDQMLPFDIFINLNFFYQASSYLSKSFTRENLVSSLAGALDRYPVVAGSITEPEGCEGLKLRTLVLDGRGVDLIYEESSLNYADLPGGDSTKLIPRSIYGNSDPLAPLFMVKCTKFTCGALCIATSINHTVADFASTTAFLQEWAKLCRGDAISPHPYVTHVWDRYPLQLFAPIHPDDITVPVGMYQPTSDAPSLSGDLLATGVQLDLVFSKNNLEDLKNSAQPLDHEQWVSTTDSVSALLWRSMTKARAAIIEPNTNVHFETAVDVRRHCENAKASDYFGNLAFCAHVDLSSQELLTSSLSSIALIIRKSLSSQLLPENMANTLSFLESVDFPPLLHNASKGDTRISSFAKARFMDDESMDFGWGPPVHFTNGLETLPPGHIYLLPCTGGCRAVISIEPEYAKNLLEDEELMEYVAVNAEELKSRVGLSFMGNA